jgi:hypothetical protein
MTVLSSKCHYFDFTIPDVPFSSVPPPRCAIALNKHCILILPVFKLGVSSLTPALGCLQREKVSFIWHIQVSQSHKTSKTPIRNCSGNCPQPVPLMGCGIQGHDHYCVFILYKCLPFLYRDQFFSVISPVMYEDILAFLFLRLISRYHYQRYSNHWVHRKS